MMRSEARIPGLRRQCACASDTYIVAGAYCPRCGDVVIYNPADVAALASQSAALGETQPQQGDSEA